MIRKTKIRWFTLLEMIIVITIMWILSVVLVESYVTISETALRVEQEKNLSEESLVITQILQSIADEATIDYEKYNNLENNSWFSNILYLTWKQWTWTSIYTTGNCLDLDWNFEADSEWNYPDFTDIIQNNSWCKLVLDQNGNITPLTAQWKVIISSAKFKIIPFDSDENYFKKEWIAINNIHQPAFWLFIHLYAPLYQPVWINKIDQPLQLFFNLNV